MKKIAKHLLVFKEEPIGIHRELRDPWGSKKGRLYEKGTH